MTAVSQESVCTPSIRSKSLEVKETYLSHFSFTFLFSFFSLSGLLSSMDAGFVDYSLQFSFSCVFYLSEFGSFLPILCM